MNRFELIRLILDDLGIDPARFSVEWISAAEGIRFVQVITEFDSRIRDLGSLGAREGIDMRSIRYKLQAALRALNGRSLRMSFAKQSKQIKEENTFGKFPAREKLMEIYGKEKTLHETLLYLQEKERSASELSGLLEIPEEEVMSVVETLRKKNMWSGELCGK
jgi:hypothetical protein